MSGKEHDQVPAKTEQDRARAKEWMEEMGFVIDDEEQPQRKTNDPSKREPAA
jgi:hypothetical protein